MQKLDIAICFFILAILICNSCNTDENSKRRKKSLKSVPVVSLAEKSITLDRTYVTNIQGVQYVEIRSRIPGYLDKIYVDEGEYVSRGKLLFHISDQEFNTEISKAKANLTSMIADVRTAELQLERIKLLVDKKIISVSEYKIAESKLKASQAKVDEARSAVDHIAMRRSYANITAPFNGVVNRIPFKVGSLMNEGTLITSISDISSVYAYFSITEQEYLKYIRSRKLPEPKEPKQVRLILADGHEYDKLGVIETVVGEFDENTGSIAFRAKFPNEGQILKHGATGKIRLTTHVEHALLLPQKAVFEIQDKNYVFVVDQANVVHMKSFVPSSRLNDDYVVESGLKKGDRVVYEGIQNVKDGMQITPVAATNEENELTAAHK